ALRHCGVCQRIMAEHPVRNGNDIAVNARAVWAIGDFPCAFEKFLDGEAKREGQIARSGEAFQDGVGLSAYRALLQLFGTRVSHRATKRCEPQSGSKQPVAKLNQ